MLQAGVAEVCITPPIGVELAGYGPDLGRYSTDVHDPLMAQAIVLDDGQQRIAIITLDVIGVSQELTQGARREITVQTGIPPQNVMIAASHSHTAPTTCAFRAWGGPDPEYVHMVMRQIAGATAAAARKLEPVMLRVGRGSHRALAWNRIGQTDVDPTVEVIRLDRALGEPLALLVHYACHPVILGPKSEISADYPGSLRRYLRERYSGGVIMFLNGACGDIDPVTNKDVWGQGTFEDMEQAGRALGEDAWNVAQTAELRGTIAIRVVLNLWTLTYDLPQPETIRQKIVELHEQVRLSDSKGQVFGAVTEQVDMPEFWLGYYSELDERLRTNQVPSEESIDLQAFILGDDIALIGIPAEVYTKEGQAIRARARYAHTLPVCYANGLLGYIPPAEEFERQGYSAMLAAAVFDRVPFQRDIASKLVTTASALLTE
jgi:neutral ceramidase